MVGWWATVAYCVLIILYSFPAPQSFWKALKLQNTTIPIAPKRLDHRQSPPITTNNPPITTKIRDQSPSNHFESKRPHAWIMYAKSAMFVVFLYHLLHLSCLTPLLDFSFFENCSCFQFRPRFMPLKFVIPSLTFYVSCFRSVLGLVYFVLRWQRL